MIEVEVEVEAELVVVVVVVELYSVGVVVDLPFERVVADSYCCCYCCLRKQHLGEWQGVVVVDESCSRKQRWKHHEEDWQSLYCCLKRKRENKDFFVLFCSLVEKRFFCFSLYVYIYGKEI